MHDRRKTLVKAKQLLGIQIQIQRPEMCLILEAKQNGVRNNLPVKIYNLQ